eukprot:c18478_g1_i1 orf=19-1590(+)
MAAAAPRRRRLRVMRISSSSSSDAEDGDCLPMDRTPPIGAVLRDVEEDDDVQLLDFPPPLSVAAVHHQNRSQTDQSQDPRPQLFPSYNVPSPASTRSPNSPPPAEHEAVQSVLRSRGAAPTSQWLAACMASLTASRPGFLQLSPTQQAELCMGQFLVADFNMHGAAVLPPQVDTLHAMELEGPFVLQVDEIINIGLPLRDRYTERTASIAGRCLKLSMTDGVQRVFGIEYRPIKSLQVLSAAGFKIAVRNVHVRRGLLMLVPEVLIVLGGCVDYLDAARKRALQEVNKPPRGQRTLRGSVAQKLSERVSAAAWPAEPSNLSTTTEAPSSGNGIPAVTNGNEHGRPTPLTDVVSSSRSYDMNSPFTYLILLKEKWFSDQLNDSTVQGRIKCILTGVKEFQFKHQDEFKLIVYLDDGSLMTDVLIDHQVVESLLGYSPRQVADGLSSMDKTESQAMKDILKQFQAFLTRFEGFMLVKKDRRSPIPVVTEMAEGCTNSNVWMLLQRVQQTMAEADLSRMATITISP